MAPVARALLKEDPNLPTMRYTLVPKVRVFIGFHGYRIQLKLNSNFREFKFAQR